MKAKSPLIGALVLLCGSLLITPLSASAIVFTGNTLISPLNTTYDGADLVISNGVLTVDGNHTFGSLRVATGAALTHTASPTGYLPPSYTATNEIQTLISTNPVALSNINVQTPAIVQDLSGTTTYIETVDYVLTESNAVTFLQRSESSSIPDGADVLVSYSFSYTGSVGTGLKLTIAGNFEVESNAYVNVDGRGYSGNTGTGKGGSSSYGTPASGAGAGHGGYGGYSSSNAISGVGYGSTTNPVTLGSPGGNSSAGVGGNGGGTIQLNVGGSLINNGVITANGFNATNSRSGGGSGGSVLLIAQTVSGNGTITADGGNGEPIHGGGGGGGRIAIVAETNAFAGTISAIGGTGWQAGGAGTIYRRVGSSNGLILIDNSGRSGAGTVLETGDSENIVISGAATASLHASQTVSNLLIASGSRLFTGFQSTFTLTVLGDATVQNGASIYGDGFGSAARSGSGVGGTYSFGLTSYGGGAGHGGYGANATNSPITIMGAGGNSYGSISTPTSLGSGGGGSSSFGPGAGGGAMRIIVNGTLNLDGKVSANGESAWSAGCGGGSGGSIWMTVETLSGSGAISADGGNGYGPTGGGGSGGRIAVTFNTNLFSGAITAFGGSGPGTNWAGAGTVYLKPLTSAGQLILDNASHLGTNTPLSGAVSSDDLVVQGRAIGALSTSQSFRNVVLSTNGFLLPSISSSSSSLSVSGDFTIQNGGAILLDGAAGSSGSGSGGTTGSTGGTHSGIGGVGTNGDASSYRNAYGYTSSPTSRGSSGAPYFLYNGSLGGQGGGAVRISASTLTVDGKITANGTDGIRGISGGASGGSIWLTVGTLSGSGIISANGGNGLNGGGGGGGGRIAVYYSNYNFSGTISTFGGKGYRRGGAGTLYSRSGSNNGGSVTVENSDAEAGFTSLSDLSSSDDLVVGANSVVTITGNGLRNMLIKSNATILAPAVTSSAGSAYMISGDVTVDQGGLISANFGAGSGTGYGSGVGTGGGYGGFGGGSTNGASGGGAYGSITTPDVIGSSGYPFNGSTVVGGRGGGAFKMIVAGLLKLDGVISANGSNGFATVASPAGGGAGGSIWLTLGGLAGSGSISANGGNSAFGGGGGSGGRIAVTYSSNSFSGTLSAYGGSGYIGGGAGTIYTKVNQSQYGSVIIDNWGISGTNTPIISSSDNLTIRNRGTGMITTSSYLHNLLIGSNGSVVFPSLSSYSLTVQGNATIQSGGIIVADGIGSLAGTGLGAGSSYGTGGGYGGYGAGGSNGTSGGNSYGSITLPTSIGSGGNPFQSTYFSGGRGGGVIQMSVAGLLSVDGKISANGTDGLYNYAYTGTPVAVGGGSGGSISLTLGGLAGTGTLSANGGSGLNGGGGGGGGRIAITYNSNLLSGIVMARGGNGYRAGGAGTIYTKKNNTAYGQVLIDNGGAAGTNTPITNFGQDVAIANEGRVNLITGMIHNLLISSNGWLLPSAQVNINGNATVLGGGGIVADGLGTSTLGLGSTTGTPKGGAGHSGFGGANSGGFGNVYGSITAPTLTGSRGGDGGTSYGTLPLGGFGGGAIRLNVNGNLSVDGRISADGLSGGLNTGGGSGGSVWLTVGGFSGAGVVSAKGGSGTGYAGGGGGGRVAISYTSNNFAGVLSAAGGIGTVGGGAGTIYTKANNQSFGQLLISNGGLTGTNTPLSSLYALPSSPFNLVVSDGASVYPAAPLPLLSNLTVSAGGLLTSAGQSNLTLAVLNDVNIESGGAISVNGKGFVQSTGPGVGQNVSSIYGTEGAGAGYGGSGGASAADAIGGTNYGSASQPIDLGSGGGLGSGPAYSGGSSGGGAIRLSVGGTLNVSGQLSADGNPGYQDNSGGGSGGSIWITAKQLSGGGHIAADGGDGELFRGGGGGGGRIAIYTPANTFTGLVSVVGGIGASSGQNGTIWTANTQSAFQITSHSPSGVLNTAVSYMDLNFNEVFDPASLTPSNMTLFTPSGSIASDGLSVSALGLTGARVSFPIQNLNGDYRLEVGSGIQDLFGQTISQVYTGAFTLTLPIISGIVTNMDGQPVSGVLLQPDGGLTGAVTDANGNYAVNIPYGWSGNVSAQSATLMFLPSSHSYTSVLNSISNENFTAVTTIAPPVSASLTDTNLLLNWNGFSGVTYQLYSSTNLIDWLPYNNPIMGGSNAVIEVQIPIDADPAMFFRVQANN